MTTHMVLVRAKEYLLNHGWKQYSFGSRENGPRCLVGAVKTGGGLSKDEPWKGAAYDALIVVRDLLGQPPANWNDHPDRSLDEVIAALDAAILATAPPKPDESPFTALEDLPAEQYIGCLSTLALIPAEALS